METGIFHLWITVSLRWQPFFVWFALFPIVGLHAPNNLICFLFILLQVCNDIELDSSGYCHLPVWNLPYSFLHCAALVVLSGMMFLIRRVQNLVIWMLNFCVWLLRLDLVQVWALPVIWPSSQRLFQKAIKVFFVCKANDQALVAVLQHSFGYVDMQPQPKSVS